MNKTVLYIIICSIFLSSCSIFRNLGDNQDISSGSSLKLNELCDSITYCNSLYISKINAEITFEESSYSSKLSLYSVPDSLIFLTAYSKGFEVFRMAITQEKIVAINRIEKSVIIMENYSTKIPVDFSDLEYLLYKDKLCDQLDDLKISDSSIGLVKYVDEFNKIITFNHLSLLPDSFEFVNTKSDEYIVGERINMDEFTVYSNLLFGSMEVRTSGGSVSFNVEKDLNWSYNQNKYDTYIL